MTVTVTGVGETWPDASTAHLFGRVSGVEARVRRAIARHRAADDDADDRFRGLYISDSEIDGLLSKGRRTASALDEDAIRFLRRVEETADLAQAKGADLRLRRLASAFGLDELDVELLLVALAPDVDPRFERLYAYLHDDVSRRRASTGLALDLCGAPVTQRGRLGPLGRLVLDGLLVVEELDRPFLTRPLRVPDRVTAHLLGDDAPDPVIADVLAPHVNGAVADPSVLARALKAGVGLVYLREPPGGAGVALALSALKTIQIPPLVLDLSRLLPDDDMKDLGLRAAREARLRGCVLVADPLDALAERGPDAVHSLAECRSTIVLVGSPTWDPRWAREPPLLLEASIPTASVRRDLWRRQIGGDRASEADPAEVTMQFRLNPEQIWRAAQAARLQAEAAGRPMSDEYLRAGARAQNAAGLERLARRIEPRAVWDDLVLPAPVLTQLRELVARVRRREVVLDDWGMGRASSKGRGIKALFAGDSGTGKTMSAEVVAAALGLDLYVIDLATVVDKYIGETEKNLDRIFREADRVNGVLLFDEADALFGKRSEVKDAHDRYANVEVAYLLQRMELFEGLAILTTNLRSNLDEAFARRLDAIVDFPMPEEEDRRQLWLRNLPADVPQVDDIDVDFLASAFRISGGNVRNIALGAAYLAADAGRPVAMRDLIRATEREYRKLGHLCLESEFGPYHALVAVPARP